MVEEGKGDDGVGGWMEEGGGRMKGSEREVWQRQSKTRQA